MGVARGLSPQQMTRALGLLARDREWRKELRKTYRRVGTVGAQMARSRLRSMASEDRRLPRSAAGLRGSSTAQEARISTGAPASAPFARAVIYGTKRRTGWFADRRYALSAARNNPEWVGVDWTVGRRGEGPRGVNDALADGEDRIVDEFAKSAMDLIARAFPRGA